MGSYCYVGRGDSCCPEVRRQVHTEAHNESKAGLCTEEEKKSARIGRQEREIYIRTSIVYTVYIYVCVCVYNIYDTLTRVYMYIYTRIKRAVYNQDEEEGGGATAERRDSQYSRAEMKEENRLCWES